MLEGLEENAPTINPDAKYWFVRTDGGLLYQAFIASNSIAIAHTAVSLGFVKALDLTETSRAALKNEIKKHYPPKTREDGRVSDLSGLAASQLLRFCIEMKRGDIVIVPSERTERLGVGIIDDDSPFEKPLTYNDESYPEFTKRRKVRWVRGVERAHVNPNLFKLLLNQQTIIDASAYSEWIDALLYEVFSKGGDFHYVLKVRSTGHIHAQALFRACLDLFELADEFAKSEGIDAGVENIETRINLNSPGDVELWKAGAEAIGLVALLVVAINGGGFDFQIKRWDLKLSLKTEGFIKRLSDFLDAKQNRKTVEEVRKKLEGLQVETPAQVIDLIKVTKK